MWSQKILNIIQNVIVRSFQNQLYILFLTVKNNNGFSISESIYEYRKIYRGAQFYSFIYNEIKW